jgi:hypothetical protein
VLLLPVTDVADSVLALVARMWTDVMQETSAIPLQKLVNAVIPLLSLLVLVTRPTSVTPTLATDPSRAVLVIVKPLPNLFQLRQCVLSTTAILPLVKLCSLIFALLSLLAELIPIAMITSSAPLTSV